MLSDYCLLCLEAYICYYNQNILKCKAKQNIIELFLQMLFRSLLFFTVGTKFIIQQTEYQGDCYEKGMEKWFLYKL